MQRQDVADLGLGLEPEEDVEAEQQLAADRDDVGRTAPGTAAETRVRVKTVTRKPAPLTEVADVRPYPVSLAGPPELTTAVEEEPPAASSPALTRLLARVEDAPPEDDITEKVTPAR